MTGKNISGENFYAGSPHPAFGTQNNKGFTKLWKTLLESGLLKMSA
jgi:hypothetical protein